MRIAITGGSGSLGSTLIRHLATTGAAERIVTMTRDEQRRLAMVRDYAWHPGVKVYAGDVRDRRRLDDLFHGCDTVVHAAARKVVSGHNDEAREMLATNIEGTMNVVEAARWNGVSRVLLISSDKAVRPENVYGVSKAMAEHLVISENARCWPRGQRMSVLRYGNVIASTGSVVRVWRDAVAAGRPIQVSDARMTRFWVQLSDAVGFVLAALGMMRGGEVFVPDLRSAPLTAIAEAVAPGWAQESIGIRPGGEKLHEELVSADEARRTVRRNEFYVVTPTQADAWDASPWVGERVPDDFAYRSDTWPRRWSPDELRRVCEVAP